MAIRLDSGGSGGGAGGLTSVPDPLSPSDGTQNITGNLAVSGGVTASGFQVATLGHTQTFTRAQGTAIVNLSNGSTINTDASLGNVFSVTLTGTHTLANPTNMVAGFSYTWVIRQDSVGNRTLNYGNSFLFEGSIAPTTSSGANTKDILSAIYDGTNLLCGYVYNVR